MIIGCKVLLFSIEKLLCIAFGLASRNYSTNKKEKTRVKNI